MSSSVLILSAGVNTIRLLSSWPRPATKVPGATSALVNDPSTMSAPRKLWTSKVLIELSLTSARADLAVADVHRLDLAVNDVGAEHRVGRVGAAGGDRPNRPSWR